MWKWLKRGLLISYLALSLPFLSKAWEAAWILFADPHSLRLMAFELRQVSPETYQQQIQAALAAQDIELANSLFALAQRQQMQLPDSPTIEQALADANSWWATTQRTGSDLWHGFIYGEAKTGTGLAASTVSDLLLIGDVRDLTTELANWPESDQLVLGLSAVGIGLTLGSLASGGTSAIASAGASGIKAAKKAGKLNQRLVQQLGKLSRSSINPAAVKTLKQQWKQAKITELNSATLRTFKQPLSQLIKPGTIRVLRKTSENIGQIGSNSGLRGAMETLDKAESVQQISRLSKISQQLQTGYLGAFKLLPRLGKKVYVLSSSLVELLASLLNVLLWLILLLINSWRLIVRLRGRRAS